MKLKILILGISGMLGHTLFKQFNKNSDFSIYGTLRNIDFLTTKEFLQSSSSFIYSGISTDKIEDINNLISCLKPNIIINCIGIIKQLPTAKDPVPSIKINALFPHQLAQICQKYHSKLIYLSTDCVFSGIKGNYTEDDNPDPIDLYGRTKLLGEVTDNNCLTLRTSIIGRELNSQNSLVEWFLSQKGKTVNGYDKAIYTGLTTQALAHLIEKIILEYPDLQGLWHVSSDSITKYQLLNMINKAFQLGITINRDEDFVCDRSLNSDRFRKHTGYSPPSWETMISELATQVKTDS